MAFYLVKQRIDFIRHRNCLRGAVLNQRDRFFMIWCLVKHKCDFLVWYLVKDRIRLHSFVLS